MQHMSIATRLYEMLGALGKAPHAAYLENFCSTTQGDLLIHVMEQALPGGCGAHLALSGGHAVPGSHRLEADAPAGIEPRAVSQLVQTTPWLRASTA